MPRKPSRGQRAFRLPRSSLRSDTCKWSIDLFAAKREEFPRKEPLSRPFGRGDSSRSAALSSPLRARGTRPSNRSGHDHRDCKRRRFGGNSYERTEPTENRTRAANATTGKWAAPANVCDNPVNHVDPSGFYSGFSSADEFGPREGAATALGGFAAEVGIGVALGSSSSALGIGSAAFNLGVSFGLGLPTGTASRVTAVTPSATPTTAAGGQGSMNAMAQNRGGVGPDWGR